MSSDKMSQNKLENSFTFGSRSARFNVHNDREGMAGRDAWSHLDSTLESDMKSPEHSFCTLFFIPVCQPMNDATHNLGS